MADELKRLRKALVKISELAIAATSGHEDDDRQEDDHVSGLPSTNAQLVCTPKALPKSLLLKAAKRAVEINSFNQPEFSALSQVNPDIEVTPAFIAVMTTKYWGTSSRTLTVSFMESTRTDLKRRILSHMNAWTRTGCIRFAETNGTGQIRISRGSGGYYSYLGTDVQLIPNNRQTMNLEGFTMTTPDSEFFRVVRHETGHTLGCPHEHMRRALVAKIDPVKAYAYFGGPPNNWSRTMVDQQVLTPLDERSLMATPADQTSIMCYQLPGSITYDGRPILGGMDINQSDYDFIGRVYPIPRRDIESSSNEECAEAWESEEDWEDS